MPIIRPDAGVDAEGLCPNEDYIFVVGCEQLDSTPEISVIAQPIGSQVTFSSFNQINAGDFEVTINVDTAGSYEFRYCCRYDD